jgi:hypothetical protein
VAMTRSRWAMNSSSRKTAPSVSRKTSERNSGSGRRRIDPSERCSTTSYEPASSGPEIVTRFAPDVIHIIVAPGEAVGSMGELPRPGWRFEPSTAHCGTPARERLNGRCQRVPARCYCAATVNWDLRHRKSSQGIRLLLAVWITVVVVVLCATGRWWGLVFVVPLVLDLYLLRRILAAGSGR